MAKKKEISAIKEDKLIHVFNNYYLGCDSLNIIVYKKFISKNDKTKFRADGFYVGGKALLHKLCDLYILEKVRDKTVVKTSNFKEIENFVNKIEEIKNEYNKIKI